MKYILNSCIKLVFSFITSACPFLHGNLTLNLERLVQPLLTSQCCILAVPVGNVSWMLFQEWRSSNLRRAVGQTAHTTDNPHVKCTGVYFALTDSNADAKWTVLGSILGILMVQLHTQLLSVRDACRLQLEQTASTLAHIARAVTFSAITYKQKEIEGDYIPLPCLVCLLRR